MMPTPVRALPAGHDVQRLVLDVAVPSSQTSRLPHRTGPASRLRDGIPTCPLPHVHHPLDPAPSPPFSPLGLRPSRRGTTCMISYFVQLIKTSGRLAPEFLAPRGDDRQLPLRVLRSLILSRSPSSPLNVLSRQIDS